MKDFDLPTVWADTIRSVPRRFMTAWVLGALGTAAPAAMRDLGDVIEMGLFFALGWPLALFLFAMGSGWWGLIAVPLLLVLAWHMFRFVQDDSPDGDAAFKVLAIAYLAGIRASGDHWPMAVLIPALFAFGHLHEQRKAARSGSKSQ